MAEMTFDGTFSDLKLKVMSESALQAIYPELVRLQDFAKSYTELEDRPGASIVIPTYDLSAAADFNVSTNNYGSGVNEISAANVTLNKHLVKRHRIRKGRCCRHRISNWSWPQRIRLWNDERN